MTIFNKHISHLFAAALPVLLAACTSETYDTGDGTYSYLRADFAELHTGDDKYVDWFNTDDDNKLYVEEPFTKSWITMADSLYRALVYYNMETSDDDDSTVSVISVSQIPVLNILSSAVLGELVTDPVTFGSVWLSKNKSYINIGFSLMTGTADDDGAVQSVGIVSTGIEILDDGTKCTCLTLYHDQGDVPEYYSSQQYISIDVDDITTPSVKITVNDYDGTVTKTLSLE